MELFSKEVSQKSEKLLLILAENKRLNLLETIYQLYVELVQEHKSQKSIEVFVASDPSEDAREKIETKLYASYGDDAKITFSKDPKMMGGLTIKVGDETLDLSIRGKVNKLVNQLNF
jgi:F-type H+-transporting ATPase subunit delta